MIVRYYRVPTKGGMQRKGVIVGYTSDRNGEPGPVCLKLGWSLCNPLDNFDRDRAKMIANGRLETRPFIVNLEQSDLNREQFDMNNSIPHSLHSMVRDTIERCRNKLAKGV